MPIGLVAALSQQEQRSAQAVFAERRVHWALRDMMAKLIRIAPVLLAALQARVMDCK